MSRLPKFVYKVPFARRDIPWSIIYVHTSYMNIPGGPEVQYRQITPTWTYFWKETQSEQNAKPVQLSEILWQYHVHRGPEQQSPCEDERDASPRILGKADGLAPGRRTRGTPCPGPRARGDTTSSRTPDKEGRLDDNRNLAPDLGRRGMHQETGG